MPDQKGVGGRPTDYSSAIADAICEAIADGQSLRTVCESDEFPHRSTVFRWLAKHEAFRDQYTQAREAQADCIFDDILDIADDGSNDWMRSKRGDDEAWVVNGEALQRSRLRVDARKWMAGKLRPKKYGDKQEIDLNAAVTVNVVRFSDDGSNTPA